MQFDLNNYNKIQKFENISCFYYNNLSQMRKNLICIMFKTKYNI